MILRRATEAPLLHAASSGFQAITASNATEAAQRDPVLAVALKTAVSDGTQRIRNTMHWWLNISAPGSCLPYYAVDGTLCHVGLSALPLFVLEKARIFKACHVSVA